jgi:hypothetical protein
MTNKTTKYFILGLCLIALFLTACRPPMKCIDNKSKYYKSTKTKNIAMSTGKINTTGTFITSDTTCNRPTFSMLKFNSNQTVQVSVARDKITKPLMLDNNSYINYLDNEVSYYYFIDEKSRTLNLERFEYWEAPWWNFFVQTNHYLVEKFNINGDTLTNQVTDRFSRFGRQYILDKKLVKNFNSIGNEFTQQLK